MNRLITAEGKHSDCSKKNGYTVNLLHLWICFNILSNSTGELNLPAVCFSKYFFFKLFRFVKVGNDQGSLRNSMNDVILYKICKLYTHHLCN